MPASELRTSPVRFTHGPLGLIDPSDPYHFVDAVVNAGDVGELIVEGEPPITAPEGWVLVKVGELYCPTWPATLEVVR